MLSQYKTVYKGGEGEIVEKKSRFIATVVPVHSEEEALKFVEAMKKKYWNATHNCYAYVIGENHELQRYSDDGEPGGTAGKPMLDVLIGEEIHNAAIVVTRYFGGTLLGTGGLVRAYSAAAKQGLASSVIITKNPGVKLRLATDYAGLGKIQYILGQRGSGSRQGRDTRGNQWAGRNGRRRAVLFCRSAGRDCNSGSSIKIRGGYAPHQYPGIRTCIKALNIEAKSHISFC